MLRFDLLFSAKRFTFNEVNSLPLHTGLFSKNALGVRFDDCGLLLDLLCVCSVCFWNTTFEIYNKVHFLHLHVCKLSFGHPLMYMTALGNRFYESLELFSFLSVFVLGEY